MQLVSFFMNLLWWYLTMIFYKYHQAFTSQLRKVLTSRRVLISSMRSGETEDFYFLCTCLAASSIKSLKRGRLCLCTLEFHGHQSWLVSLWGFVDYCSKWYDYCLQATTSPASEYLFSEVQKEDTPVSRDLSYGAAFVLSWYLPAQMNLLAFNPCAWCTSVRKRLPLSSAPVIRNHPQPKKWSTCDPAAQGVWQLLALWMHGELLVGGWCCSSQDPAELGEWFPVQRKHPKHAVGAAKSQRCCYRGDRERGRERACKYMCVGRGMDQGKKIGRNYRNKRFLTYFTSRVTSLFFTQSCCSSPSFKWVMATIPTLALYKRSSFYYFCHICPFLNRSS